ncbi:iron donor protein CyaY [Endozoicomonas sp. (ex Bugula neritina AB1)]|nr:iron donor protein CyaY [Endozoicomonas sp. (ex Bugula neritina AB1)]
MAMNEAQYSDLLDDLMVAIEDAIEDAQLDIDYETAAGILTLTCPDDSKVILSRQTPLLQLWLAAKSGGFHFDYSEDQQEWVLDGSGESFTGSLNRCLSEQYGQKVELII